MAEQYRVLRVVANEEHNNIAEAEEEYGYWETEISVDFREAEIVFDDKGGDFDTHSVTDERKTSDQECMGIPWDYDGDSVTLIVLRYSDGDTFGHCSGYWRILKVFATHKEAKMFLEETDVAKEYDEPSGYFSSYESHECITLPFYNGTIKRTK